MRPFLAPLLTLPLILVALPACAQSVQWPQALPTPYGQPTVTTGDLHRYEMDRLRTQSDQNQALAQSQALQTQITIESLQAQRQPPLIIPETTRAHTLEEARRDREATEARSATVARSTAQIDGWLDRRPQ